MDTQDSKSGVSVAWRVVSARDWNADECVCVCVCVFKRLVQLDERMPNTDGNKQSSVTVSRLQIVLEIERREREREGTHALTWSFIQLIVCSTSASIPAKF